MLPRRVKGAGASASGAALPLAGEPRAGPIEDAGASAQGIVIPRQVAQIGRGTKRSSQSRRGLNSLGRAANSGQRHRIAPIGREAKSRGQCVIIVAFLNEVIKIWQCHQRFKVDDRIVIILLGVSRGVVSFNLRRINLVVARRGRGRGVIERDEGVERLSNTLPKTSSDARCSACILRSGGPIVGRNRVGALVARPGVAASAWPPCLGAGTVAQGAGGSNQAEAAEVLVGLGRLLPFVIPAPLGGCARRR